MRLNTIKPAEDGEGWVVRLYESRGGRTSTRLTFAMPVREVWLSNTLEDRLEAMEPENGAFPLHLRGFELRTVRVV